MPVARDRHAAPTTGRGAQQDERKLAGEHFVISQPLARKLRALPEQDFAGLEADGAEFALVMIRRTEDGVVMLGEVPDDVALVEKAARRLLG